MEPRTARRLRSLLERKRRAEAKVVDAGDQLALAVLAASEQEGASRRQIARELGVAAATVQDWVDRGEQLRSS